MTNFALFINFPIENRKQQYTGNGFQMVENCDTMLEILHKHRPFERIRDPENCDVRVNFFRRFFTWPRNYYNDNNIYFTIHISIPHTFALPNLQIFYAISLFCSARNCFP